MRILIITQYFWPENFLINDIAFSLKERGHKVFVLTAKPNYPNGRFFKGYTFLFQNTEIWKGIKIYRSPLIPRGSGKGFQLFLNYISFALFSSVRLLFIFKKIDKILVYQPSPVTVGLPGIVAKYRFKAPIYFWVQDLWPESISAAGGVDNKFVLKIFDNLTRYIYRHSKKILVQSKAFVPYILNQNINIDKLVYFPNTTDLFYKPKEAKIELLKNLPSGIKLMFAGNIGEAQSFDTLLKAAFLLKDEKIEIHWIIIGTGRLKAEVELKIKELGLIGSFHLLGSYPSIDMPDFFSCVDALIVSLKNSPIFSITIPSKIQSYLACGKPIIASLNGEGARIIKEAKAGFVCNAEDAFALKESVKSFLLLSVDERKILGENGRKYFDQEFSREILIDKFEVILS